MATPRSLSDLTAAEQAAVQANPLTDLTVTQRLAALEARTIAIGDLPIAQLQRKLENEWHPDANTLLLPRSIGAELLDASVIPPEAYNSATVTGTTDGTGKLVMVVTHGLGSTPSFAGAVTIANNDPSAPSVSALNATTFTVTLQTGLLTTSVSFLWIAFR